MDNLLMNAPVTDDDRMAVLGLLGGSLVRGDFGGGLLAANGYLNEAPDRRMKQALMAAQMQNFASEAEMRKLQADQARWKMGLINGAMGGVGGTPAPSQPAIAPSAGGALGSGTFGIPMGGQPAVQPGAQGSDWLARLTPGQIGALKTAGIDLFNEYKLAKEGFTVNPGTFRQDPYSNQLRFIADPNKPNTVDASGNVSVQPGFNAAATSTTLATELPKAFAGQAFGGNVRPGAGPNERSRFVPNMEENPFMQQYATMLFGGQMPKLAPGVVVTPAAPNGAGGGQPSAPSATAPAKSASTPALIQGRDDLVKTIEGLQANLADAKPGSTLAQRLQTDIDAANEQLRKMPAAQAPQAAPAKGGYGLSKAEEISSEADKARALGKVTQEQKQITEFAPEAASFRNSINSLDRLSNAASDLAKHPGLKGIYGLRGAIPNVPGTDAADAQALLDTLKSQVGFAVLQDMRNNSKTGGALGQVSDRENSMLQANLAALDKAQSVEQAKRSLQAISDYASGAQGRLRDAFKLQQRFNPEAATVPDQTPKQNVVPSLPKSAPKGARARDTTTGQVLTFNGLNWVPEK